MKGEVPSAIAQTWMADWEKLMDKETIPTDLFKLNKILLKGYTFKYEDFLYIFNYASYHDIDKYRVNFCFANHKFGEEDKEGTFGLVMLANKPITERLENEEDGIYYDMSAPCPPTC